MEYKSVSFFTGTVLLLYFPWNYLGLLWESFKEENKRKQLIHRMQRKCVETTFTLQYSKTPESDFFSLKVKNGPGSVQYFWLGFLLN